MTECKTYSQAGQDVWVLSLFPAGYEGYFLDCGCGDAHYHNNTLLLEEHGWDGLAIDIMDFSAGWKERKTQFIQANVFVIPDLFPARHVDYLSIDIDTIGANYQLLKKFMDCSWSFAVLTIEHNLYLGERYHVKERQPQRELLIELGYQLVKADVAYNGNKFEDWWVNPKYIKL